MNAYELADALAVESSQMEYGYVVDDWELLYKSANMLRQQADRIAELEKQGEPVAWLNGNEICPEIGYEATITTEHPKDLGWKPLYTTPQTKPLSDEEIGEIYWNLYADDWTEEDIKFARAIEERHGIK